MKNFRIFTIVISVVLFLFIVWIIYKYSSGEDVEKAEIRDFKEIVDEGVLRVVFNIDPVDYFVYEGSPLGFQLEMIEAFSKRYGLELEIIVESDLDSGIELLRRNKADILAQGIIQNSELDLKIDMTKPIRETKLVLIQRSKDSVGKNIETIKSINDIQSAVLYVSSGTRNLNSFKVFIQDFAKNISVREIDSLSQEQLINMVASCKIDYAVCAFEYSILARNYYQNIDNSVDMSLPLNIVWGVRENSPVLLDSLNVWIEKFKESDDYRRLSLKYINKFRHNFNIESEFHSHNKARLSEYDELFYKHATVTGWDWRLIASLAYEESRFNPNAQSWAGATGLMQLLPVIYRKYKDEKYSGVESEIFAACNYLSYIKNLLQNELNDTVTILKSSLASYNIGPGHIMDAICLCKKYNKDCNDWDNLSYYIINLSNRKYYTDTCVKNGYFPGIFSVEFANSVYNRYKHYLNIIPAKPQKQ